MRTIPIRLQDHLRQPATTTCILIKIMLRDGRVYGFASTNDDIDYDDGFGELTYNGMRGVEPSTLVKSDTERVANAEATSLLATDASGITESMIESGELQDAEWIAYLVNYGDLSQQHAILDAGDVGEVKKRYGLVWVPELLSYSVRMRQASGTHWSRSCRAVFGNHAQGQFYCGVDAESLWVSGTITSLGEEADLVFAISAAPGMPIVPGRIQALSGVNVGRVRPIETHTGGIIVLSSPFPRPMSVGDQIRVRPDCAKTTDACKSWGNYLNMRAEPRIPTGDSAATQSPGAEVLQRYLGDWTPP